MKKAILIVLCMAGLSATAQKRGEHGHGKLKDLNPDQIATLQTKKMTLALDLTQDQQAKIKAIHLKQAKERQQKMEERKAAKEGEAKRPTDEERYAMQNARLDKMIAHKAEMKSILSNEQFEKWQKMQKHRRKSPGKRDKGKREGASRR